MRPIGRILAVLVAAAVLFVVASQFRGIVARNVALARELDRTRGDVANLRARKLRETREIERLQTPEGAIPQIHDKLRMVEPHEEMIYLNSDVPPTAAPDLSGSSNSSAGAESP